MIKVAIVRSSKPCRKLLAALATVAVLSPGLETEAAAEGIDESSEIVVTGHRENYSNLFDTGTLWGWFMGGIGDWGGGGGAAGGGGGGGAGDPTPPDPQQSPECKAAKAEMDKAIAAAEQSGKKVILLGEDHFASADNSRQSNASQYPELIDQLLKPGDCLGMEASARSDLEYPEAQGYLVALDYAASKGVRVYYIDGASTYSDWTGGNAPFSLAATNTRDALMANFINSIVPTCNRVVTINGMNHLAKDVGPLPAEGRSTLPDQLDGKAVVIDGRQVEKACQ